MTTHEYRVWLQQKLDKCNISRDYMLGLVIVLERTLQEEKRKLTNENFRFFYKLFNGNGKPTRAWLYTAELALFLRYRHYPVEPYIRSLCSLPKVRYYLRQREQISLNRLVPSTRKSAEEIRKLEQHFLLWARKHSFQNSPF